MRKIGKKIAFMLSTLSAFACLAVALPQAAVSHAENTPILATAETKTAEQTKLISPSSYEEYLRLNDPADISVTDGYTAIADGKNIYLYNRVDGVYQKYDKHPYLITKLQFSQSNVLYFLDSENTLYTLNAVGFNGETAAQSTGISNCLTFALYGETVYYTTMSGISTTIYSAPLSAPTAKTELISERMYCPAIAFSGGALYYMKGDEYLRKYNPVDKTNVSVAELPTVRSLTVTENTLICVSENGKFSAYSLADGSVSEIFSATGDYSALCSKNENVYVLKGNTVQNFSIASTSFTNFEIANKSASAHRLNGAKEVCLKDDLLFIADAGNSRVSVYDTENNAFLTAISTTAPTAFLASDGETLLTAGAGQAFVYDLGENNYGATLSELPSAQIHGNVIGVTEVYGTYYVATDTNRLYYAAENNGAFSWTETQRETHTASLLTSDVYGNIYTAYGNKLYRYTEAEFASASASGEEIISSLPAGTSKILLDFSRNVYALNGNNVSVYSLQGENYVLTSTHVFDKPLVYETAPVVKSLTFGAEDNQAYVLYEGDYLAETTALNLATLKTIPTQNTQEIFDNDLPQVTLTKVQKGALEIHFDIEKLQNATAFPYLSHERATEEQTALVLGESGDYNVLSIYNSATNSRESCLVLKENCQPLQKADYCEEYAEAKTAYLVSTSNAYKFPYLSDLVKKDCLDVHTKIRLLAKVKGLETEYFEISYTNAEGVEKVAYLPTSFVTEFDGAAPDTITQTYGDPVSDRDSIFRLVYILLGGVAICILVDFLFLRPRKKDEYEDET